MLGFTYLTRESPTQNFIELLLPIIFSQKLLNERMLEQVCQVILNHDTKIKEHFANIVKLFH